MDAGHAESPSWADDPEKMHMFTYGIRKLMDRANVAADTRQMLFAEEETQRFLMTHAAHMERKGGSFTEQQLGAGELAIQMTHALERRKASEASIEREEDTRREEMLDEALRTPIKQFLDMYDQLEGRRRGYYAAAVHIIYQGVLDVFGTLDGFFETSDDMQLHYVAKLKPPHEHMNRYSEDVVFVHKLSRVFVSSVLLLMLEERKVSFDMATFEPSVELRSWIGRLTEIAEEGRAAVES